MKPTSANGVLSEVKSTSAIADWAKRTKHQIEAEFDAVAACLRTIAVRQKERDRVHTQAILGILEEKRVEVLGQTESPDFVYGWHDVATQVRQLVFEDARYKAIRQTRTVPRRRLKHGTNRIVTLQPAG